MPIHTVYLTLAALITGLTGPDRRTRNAGLITVGYCAVALVVMLGAR